MWHISLWLHTHHEEIAGQCALIQIVVRQIKHLQQWECTKASRQRAQSIDGQIQDAKLWQRWNWDWKLFNVIVGQVENFQVGEIRDARWDC